MMTKQRILLIGLLMGLAMSLLTACNLENLGNLVKGSGVSKTEKREVGAFDAIDASIIGEISVKCQDKQSIEIQGDDNILPLITMEVKNNTLRIKATQGYLPKSTLKLSITTPKVDAFSLSGAGEVKLTNVKSESLKVELSGAGSLDASGEAKQLTVNLSGAGSVNAKDLHTDKAAINASGAGGIVVTVAEQLDANVSGAGSVDYYGDPKTVNKNVSGIGSVNKK
jgi:hypothetical protein